MYHRPFHPALALGSSQKAKTAEAHRREANAYTNMSNMGRPHSVTARMQAAMLSGQVPCSASYFSIRASADAPMMLSEAAQVATRLMGGDAGTISCTLNRNGAGLYLHPCVGAAIGQSSRRQPTRSVAPRYIRQSHFTDGRNRHTSNTLSSTCSRSTATSSNTGDAADTFFLSARYVAPRTCTQVSSVYDAAIGRTGACRQNGKYLEVPVSWRAPVLRGAGAGNGPRRCRLLRTRCLLL